jgi:hypothetical protein
MRVFAISDLHTDFRENMRLVEELPAIYRDDALIVAGDIADRMEVIAHTLLVLRSKFSQVFYLPGNHELWIRNGQGDSLEKFHTILALCKKIDVKTRPTKVVSCWVVPLFSWYSASFDLDDNPEWNESTGWADFYFCKWPAAVEPLAEYFLKLNEVNIKYYDAPVISFSHFLPRRELLPLKEYLRFKDLPKVAGCVLLEEQIRKLQSQTHIFGHSHINRDCLIDGVRYIQNALSYPKERKTDTFPLKQVWPPEKED